MFITAKGDGAASIEAYAACIAGVAFSGNAANREDSTRGIGQGTTADVPNVGL